MKLWFKDRGKKPSNHFLSHPISHHRNAERSKLRRTGAFGNEDTAQRQGPERSRFQLPHQRREVFLEVGSKHLNADLVHPRGPAIPLDGLEGLSHEPGGDPPGQRVDLDLFHGEPFTRCNHEVRTGGLWGMFLSVAAVAAFPGFPGKSAGRPIWGLSQGANFPHGLAGRSPSSVGFSFHFAPGREATPDLLLPLKRRRFRRPSPHRRVAGPFRLWLIGSTYRPSDGGGLHRSWLGTIFSRRRHASPSWSAAGNPHAPAVGREVRALVSASSKGGEWRTKQAENAVSRSHLAWPLRHAAFSGNPGGDVAGCVPPRKLRSSSKVFCTGAVPHR